MAICCGDSVVALSLQDLTLGWVKKADDITCFEIKAHESDFIIHGECQISRLNQAGQILWRFTGPDIFTTANGMDAFSVDANRVTTKCWDDVVFELDATTGKILSTR